MTGDQVYADVAGPMLRAIHSLIARLGLFDEQLEGAVVTDSQALYQHPASYYHRADLLPAQKLNETLRERFSVASANRSSLPATLTTTW